MKLGEITLTAASIMPMAPRGVEVIAGITNDPVFGPLVAFGSGGVIEIDLYRQVLFIVDVLEAALLSEQ